MPVGIPKEIKDKENRAGMVPSSVHELVHHAHEVLVQEGLGQGICIGFDLSDDDYFGLNNATLPYVLRLADAGWEKALAFDSGFFNGLNVHAGTVCCEAIASAHNLPNTPAEQLLNQ
ncbi:MAG: hypothetical protein P8J61_00170 [Gammaproteobacteria bacterium]|jgi:alanine dehydrogenase|nr:hypothetical protein [Gammaproteobacteria bacterium]